MATTAGGIGVWHLDATRQAVQVEGNLLALLGYPESEVGELITDWFALIPPDDVGDVESRLNAHLAGMSPAFEAEFRMIARHGQTTPKFH